LWLYVPKGARPPKGREEAPVQISRLLHAHEIVLKEARTMARLAAEHGDDGTNDLIMSDVIRPHGDTRRSERRERRKPREWAEEAEKALVVRSVPRVEGLGRE